MPSTLNFGAKTRIYGFETDTESISPLVSSLGKTGLFRTHTQSFKCDAGMWACCIGSLNRFLLINSSKSTSMFFPRA